VSTQRRMFTEKSTNYEPVYEGDVMVEGLGLKLNFVPWDIKEPQPVIVALEQAGGFVGDVLDAGSGMGYHSIYLASRGHRVTGVDSSPTAVAKAAERAAERGVDVKFMVADVTRLDGLEPGFTTALDYGLFHCLKDEQRRQYAAAMHRVCAPGARWHLFCFPDNVPPGLPPAWVRVSQENLHANLDRHWRILSIEEKRTATVFTRDFLEQQRNSAPAGAVEVNPDVLDEDESGRILLPMSHVQAERI